MVREGAREEKVGSEKKEGANHNGYLQQQPSSLEIFRVLQNWLCRWQTACWVQWPRKPDVSPGVWVAALV